MGQTGRDAVRALSWLATAALVVLAGDAWAQAPADMLRLERESLRARHEVLRRLLPDGPEVEEARRKLEALVVTSGIKRDTSEYRIEAPVDTAHDAYLPVDVSGEATYAALDALVDALFRLPRVVTIGSLEVSGVSDERLRFVAALRFQFWPKAAPVPSAMLGPRQETMLMGADPETAAAFRREVALHQAKTARVEQHKRTQRHPLRVLAAFDGARVALAAFSFDGSFHLRGSRALPGPSLRETLAHAGAAVTTLEARPAGACESFEAHGTLGADIPSWTADRTALFAPGPACEAPSAARPRPIPGRVPEAARLRTADGTTFSFELVRSAGGGRPDLLLSTSAMTGSRTASRVLADRKRRYFGYSLTAEPLDERRFRVAVGPLDVKTRERLSREHGDLMGESVAIRYPEPQVVASGEPLLLELMVNPNTHEKLCDVIRVSAPTPSPVTLLQITNGALSRNGGTYTTRTGTARGPRLSFLLNDVGLVSVGLEREEKRRCVPGRLTQDKNAMWSGVLAFEWEKDRYEWLSRDLIVPEKPDTDLLWVCVDTARRPTIMDTSPVAF
jgi:hypothetical protein